MGEGAELIFAGDPSVFAIKRGKIGNEPKRSKGPLEEFCDGLLPGAMFFDLPQPRRGAIPIE